MRWCPGFQKNPRTNLASSSSPLPGRHARPSAAASNQQVTLYVFWWNRKVFSYFTVLRVRALQKRQKIADCLPYNSWWSTHYESDLLDLLDLALAYIRSRLSASIYEFFPPPFLPRRVTRRGLCRSVSSSPSLLGRSRITK